MKILLFVLIIEVFHNGNTQQYPSPVTSPYDQNATLLPYPYQTVLGINPVPKIGTPYQGFAGPNPYPFGFNTAYPNPVNMYDPYAFYAQQGIPTYQFPENMYPGYSAYQQQYGYPQIGMGYGYAGGLGQPAMGYPQATKKVDQPTNVKTEILDVSPEYQRQLLGWPAQDNSGFRRVSVASKLRYTVDVDTQTTNKTVIPMNLTKPIITEKKFLTSIKRTFVYDSTKPETFKPIDIHIVNGNQVTTIAPPEVTVDESVAGLTTSSVKPSGRRFMDVPQSCPSGTKLAHNGKCLEPFLLRDSKTATHVEEDAMESDI